jgi:hypothetical protein
VRFGQDDLLHFLCLLNIQRHQPLARTESSKRRSKSKATTPPGAD